MQRPSHARQIQQLMYFDLRCIDLSCQMQISWLRGSAERQAYRRKPGGRIIIQKCINRRTERRPLRSFIIHNKSLLRQYRLVSARRDPEVAIYDDEYSAAKYSQNRLGPLLATGGGKLGLGTALIRLDRPGQIATIHSLSLTSEPAGWPAHGFAAYYAWLQYRGFSLLISATSPRKWTSYESFMLRASPRDAFSDVSAELRTRTTGTTKNSTFCGKHAPLNIMRKVALYGNKMNISLTDVKVCNTKYKLLL